MADPEDIQLNLRLQAGLGVGSDLHWSKVARAEFTKRHRLSHHHIFRHRLDDIEAPQTSSPSAIRPAPGLNGESPGEEPATNPTEVEIDGGETPNSLVQRPRFSWKAVTLGIWVVMLCGVAAVVLDQITTQQSLTAQLQNMAKTAKQLQMKNDQLKQQLHSTCQNVTLEGEAGQLELPINYTATQLSLLLKDTLQEKAQLQVTNDELKAFLNATLESCHLAGDENRKLNLLQNRSMQIIALASAENQQLLLRLKNEQQTSAQLEAENRHQLSILSSSRLSFLWRFCSNESLQCSRCIPGWVEHASRCFFWSKEKKKWEAARRYCLDMGGDLATVWTAEDQAFLTNLTYQFKQKHPKGFHSAWIGFQDLVKEGQHRWVSGHKTGKDLIYWKTGEPNNASPSWDTDNAGQDCVAIVPPAQIEAEDWLNSWDDIVCVGERNYICETMALSLP